MLPIIWYASFLFGPLAVAALPGSRTPAPFLEKRQSSDRPCGLLFDTIKEDLAEKKFPLFLASDVYACLITVPFLADPALRFIEYYNTTLQFQSTLPYLKYPPGEYQQPAIDIFKELQTVKEKVQSGVYKNQYDFENDILKIVYLAHDGHLSLNFGISSAFVFASSVDIVSASVDGEKLPKPYIKSHVLAAQEAEFEWQPSPIATINGVEATKYLVDFASRQSFGNLEPHADYNHLFENPVNDVLGVWGIWGGNSRFYPGSGLDDNIHLRLENGSEVTGNRWLALLDDIHSTGPLETGGDMYNYFVLGLLPASHDAEDDDIIDYGGLDDAETANSDKTTWLDQSDGAFPEPSVEQFDLFTTGGGILSGYILPNDVAVLSVPSFDQHPEAALNFSLTVKEFIERAEESKAKKVVIDLQQNRGGNTGLAFDTFRRFFPYEPADAPWTFAASRRRSHKLANILGEEITTWWQNLDEDDEDDLNLQWDEAANEWVSVTRINAVTNKTFTSWAEYSPDDTSYRGDRMSKVERYNMSDTRFLYSAFSATTAEMDPYGFGLNPVKKGTKQVFDPANIVLLTDGLCASACSIFAEMMTSAGVKTVVVGGKPEYTPMQAVAGTRGARAYSGEVLDWMLQFAGTLMADNSSLPNIPANRETRDTGFWIRYSGFNLRDQISKAEFDKGTQMVPLQFDYLAAHCRIFYTIRNIYNMTQLWLDAAAAMFDNYPGGCVRGSTGYADESPSTPATKSPLSHFDNDDTVIRFDGERGGGEDEDSDEENINEGDLVASSSVIQAGLQPCVMLASGKWGGCPKNHKCREVDVKCKSSEREKNSMAMFCLPPCVSGKVGACQEYRSNPLRSSALRCRARSQTETKELGSLSSSATQTKEGVIGLCQPDWVRSKDYCVKKSTSSSSSSSGSSNKGNDAN
ncbi:hypothetical protein QBC40DRAFT_229528 [Triangularia verruculosa]|uniref:Tail specific protease domain-containing protein n=1 Tax=Triangularia verruculosa TaxID=2587418 RepID=A0AAN7AU40_9PEZI|nr:hypothetical protein QBC40DRAFT_229528 [Triangularia verruculosa]